MARHSPRPISRGKDFGSFNVIVRRSDSASEVSDQPSRTLAETALKGKVKQVRDSRVIFLNVLRRHYLLVRDRGKVSLSHRGRVAVGPGVEGTIGAGAAVASDGDADPDFTLQWSGKLSPR